MPQDVTSALDALYRSEWGRIVAALIRLFGDFEAAEEAAQEAFAAAVDQWPASGVPEFPRAWIIQTARHKAIDRMRRQGRFQEKLESYVVSGFVRTLEEPNYDTDEIPDDRLRLIFTCLNPARPCGRRRLFFYLLKPLPSLGAEERASQCVIRAGKKMARASERKFCISSRPASMSQA